MFCLGYSGEDCSIDDGQDVRDDFINYDYDADIDFNDNYTVTLGTDYGYDVTFDLNFLLDGQGVRQFYELDLSDRIVVSLINDDIVADAYQELGTTECSKVISDGTDYTDISTFTYAFKGYIYRQRKG